MTILSKRMLMIVLNIAVYVDGMKSLICGQRWVEVFREGRGRRTSRRSIVILEQGSMLQ